MDELMREMNLIVASLRILRRLMGERKFDPVTYEYQTINDLGNEVNLIGDLLEARVELDLPQDAIVRDATDAADVVALAETHREKRLARAKRERALADPVVPVGPKRLPPAEGKTQRKREARKSS